MFRNRKMVIDRLESRCYLTSVGWDGPGLGEASLTYYLGDVPSAVDEAIFRDAIEQAFDVWGDVVQIDFTETESPRQRNSIDLTFAEIDGPGGTLAQAYLPRDVNFGRIAGDIEFDQEESWELGNARRAAATDLLYVAVHEIGHALGLEHTENRDDVMFASISTNAAFPGLSQGDVDAILSLYAPRTLNLLGDLDGDGTLSVTDIDLMYGQLRDESQDEAFDLNADGMVDEEDRDVLVEDVFETTYGDANLDGVFNPSDVIMVLSAALYEKANAELATWETGDWDGDGRFDASDVILALARGNYQIG